MLYSNKKKIRGWRRKIRQIDDWANNSVTADVRRFLDRGEDYVKIRIDPWNRLCEDVPPNWYFKKIIAQLIMIHDSWLSQYKSLGIPFDLQIWLNDPNTIRSEVVCTKVEKWGDRKTDYYRKSNDRSTFPLMKWRSNDYDLNRFEWDLYDDEDLHFKNLQALDEEEISDLLDLGFKEEETTVYTGEKDTLYSKKAGNVWIGRLK